MRRGNRVGMLIAMGMMLVLCSVLFSGVEKQGKDSSPQKAKDTFYYNGDNIKEYRGESIFYVDMTEGVTEEQGYELEKREKTLGRNVKTMIVPDKYDDMFSLEFIWYFAGIEKLKVGERTDMHTLSGAQSYYYQQLKEVQISKKNKTCFSVDGVAYGSDMIYQVPQKWKRKKLVIPSKITYINTEQIMGSKVEEIVLHKNIREVAIDDESAWEGGDSPEYGYGENEFQEQKHLKKITLPKGSKYYKMKDGVLYRKEGNGKYEFEGYPVANKSRKKVRILEGTTTLKGMYIQSKKLKVILPRSLKKYQCLEEFDVNVQVKKGSKYFAMFRGNLYDRKKTKLYHFYRNEKKIPTIYVPPTMRKVSRGLLTYIKKMNVYIKGGKTSKQWKRFKKQSWCTRKRIVRPY